MNKFFNLLVAGLLAAALLASCNLPFLKTSSAAVQTAAALTVQAELTQAAPLATPTSTSAPFPTLPPAATLPVTTLAPAATSTSNCDKAGFIGETVPDNSGFGPGDAFTKTWTLQNIGTCSWTPSYTLVFVSGDLMNGPSSVALSGNVNTNQNVTLSVNLTAPTADGTYRGNWGLRNASGTIFSSFWVQIVVGSASGGAFAVTHVDFNVTGSCGNFHTTVSITTNGAGTVNYHKIFSDGGTDTLPGTMTFASAGTHSFNFDNSMSAPHTTTWIDLYIDSPNHQQFGRASYSCP